MQCQTIFCIRMSAVRKKCGGLYLRHREEEQQVYEEMSSEHPDVARVTEIAKNKNCRYIVFNTSFHQIPEDLTEYGYEKIAVIEDVYAVYSRIGS